MTEKCELNRVFQDLENAVVAFQIENQNDSSKICEMEQLRKSQFFKTIDFKNIVVDPKSKSSLVLSLHASKELVKHTLPPIDRCCKLSGRSVTYDGVDKFQR